MLLAMGVELLDEEVVVTFEVFHVEVMFEVFQIVVTFEVFQVVVMSEVFHVVCVVMWCERYGSGLLRSRNCCLNVILERWKDET